MLVRKAKNKDKNSILEFQLAMAKETENIDLDPETVANGVLAVIKDSTKGCYYVAEKEDKVIGSLLTTYEWSDWRNGTILWIQSVYVLPEYRRKGVYSLLYSHIKKLVFENNDLKGIRLYTEKNNLTAQKAYKKLGMDADHYITFEWLK
jgi:ribosomal protein S18 acetylase RimI-like enzyme